MLRMSRPWLMPRRLLMLLALPRLRRSCLLCSLCHLSWFRLICPCGTLHMWIWWWLSTGRAPDSCLCLQMFLVGGERCPVLLGHCKGSAKLSP